MNKHTKVLRMVILARHRVKTKDVLLARALGPSELAKLELIMFHFTIRGKLSKIRCNLKTKIFFFHSGDIAIHYICEEGSVNVLQYLLKRPVDLSIKNSKGTKL